MKSLSPLTSTGHVADAPGECILGKGGQLALVLRADVKPAETTFVTDPSANFQVGFIVYPSAGHISRHMHRPPRRQVERTSEALLVRSGRCVATIYDEDGAFVQEVGLGQGDVLVIFAGGHEFRMTENTVMLEIKQGPYAGAEEKRSF